MLKMEYRRRNFKFRSYFSSPEVATDGNLIQEDVTKEILFELESLLQST